jgi:hypothetical protein
MPYDPRAISEGGNVPDNFCRSCGTIPGPREKKCETPEEIARCPWMVGVVRITPPANQQH